MPDQPLSWLIVDQVAERLGAKDEARRKWRQNARGVPWRWRVQIVEELLRTGVPVSLADFERLESNPGRIAA